MKKHSDIGGIWHINPSLPGRLSGKIAHDIFRCLFFNENVGISIEISMKIVHKGPIDNKPALVQVMVWRRTDDKTLPERMLTQFTDAYMRHYGRWVNSRPYFKADFLHGNL